MPLLRITLLLLLLQNMLWLPFAFLAGCRDSSLVVAVAFCKLAMFSRIAQIVGDSLLLCNFHMLAS